MKCEYYGNFNWVTGDITIDWLLPDDRYHGPQGPWWQCIQCDQLFYSTSMCLCDNCNPFSGYCRGCHPK